MEPIEQIKDWVKDYCNNDFLDEDGNEDLPAGVDLFLDRAVKHFSKEAGLKSETLGDHSVSFDPAELPDKLLDMLTPYRRVRFK